MGTVAAIGARAEVGGLALAGVDILVADDADAVRRAWLALPRTVSLVIVTPDAADALQDRTGTTSGPDPSRPLIVEMPR